MNQYYVEYYSNDESEWLKCSPAYHCLDDAIQSMRLQAERDPNLAHQVIQSISHQTRIALSVHGEEIVKTFNRGEFR